MIAAGNEIVGKPYLYGGAHGLPLSDIAPAYDCSSSVEHLLYGARLLPVGYGAASSALESFGGPGPGRWVTLYASARPRVHVRRRPAVGHPRRGWSRRRQQRGSAGIPLVRSAAGFVAQTPGGAVRRDDPRVARSPPLRRGAPRSAGAARSARARHRDERTDDALEGRPGPGDARVRRRRQPRPRRRIPAPAAPLAGDPPFATAYINWQADTVTQQMRALAAQSVGQARSEMELAAAHTAQRLRAAARRHREQRHRRGDRAAVRARRDEYVVVTRERTTATATHRVRTVSDQRGTSRSPTVVKLRARPVGRQPLAARELVSRRR